ncbi:MAG TPA: MmgE/PrpD family protein [Candidatus Methylomirabilis sp.]|nr:MmgE/PrpD family protein [Candidatus Methylomirabilis sp.]
MDRILDFLSDYGVSMTYDRLSGRAVHEVKRRVIDTLGCAMGSYQMLPPKMARAHALEVTSTPGSTVLGTRHRSAPELAAFANGVMARYADFNDMSVGRKAGHPSDNIPAVFAATEYAGTDMRSAIAGIVLAYEVQDRVGDVCEPVIDGGWDYVVYTSFAAAAGAGRAMGLSREQLANALALAVAPNGPMFQTRVGQLSMWKGCAAANAARNGVFAALLARRGLTGPAEAFEGACGFNKLYGVTVKLPAFGGGAIPFTIEHSRFKAFPCDYEAQCCVTPAAELHKVLQGQLQDVEKIAIETYEHAVQCSADTRDKWNPATRETADHSLPYVVAVALSRGTVWVDDFVEERIRDPKIHALMQKIEVRAIEEFNRAWPEAYPFRITATMRSGQEHVQEVHYAKGHPKNPMADHEIEAKFRRLAEPVMGPAAADRALSALWQLEKLKNVQELFSLFVLDAA